MLYCLRSMLSKGDFDLCGTCSHFSQNVPGLKFKRRFPLLHSKYWRYLLSKIRGSTEGVCGITVIDGGGKHIQIIMRRDERCLFADGGTASLVQDAHAAVMEPDSAGDEDEEEP